jgi:hypothetical protein
MKECASVWSPTGHLPKEIPSETLMAARLANATKIADRISGLIEAGHRVFDEDGDEVVRVDRRPNGDLIYRFKERGSVMMFMNDRTWDGGALDEAAAYTDSFAGWTYIHPSHIQRLFS